MSLISPLCLSEVVRGQWCKSKEDSSQREKYQYLCKYCGKDGLPVTKMLKRRYAVLRRRERAATMLGMTKRDHPINPKEGRKDKCG